MPLQSKLFQGDRALNACLVEDAAHLTIGAAGDHVSKLHTALLALDDLPVAVTELNAKRYGPSTAAAVLAFKKRRAIINISYQKDADNIVGKMTIAAMDREMIRKEGEPPGPPGDPRRTPASN